jgi:hypothetical protein
MNHALPLLPAAIGLLATALSSALHGADSEPTHLARLLSSGELTVHNRALQPIQDGDRAAVKFDARAGNGLAWLGGSDFATGEIECDIKGRNNPGRSFVGIAFHGVDDNTYEALYLRPFNFASDDPARRAHSVQYISMPDHDWSDLRQKHPGVFESAIAPAPAPEHWVHVRIVVEATRVTVFINEATEPCLMVERISGRASGRIGLWVGNGSDGWFANLKVTRADARAVEPAGNPTS